jgi:hypothetical protein
MLEFYKRFCDDAIPVGQGAGYWDPMLEEFSAMCDSVMRRPISFSPSPPREDELTASPTYVSQSALWDKIADLNAEASALCYSNVSHFGPGAQLTKEVGGQLVEAGITEQVADMILEERRSSIVDSMFVPCEKPILPDSVPLATKGRTRADSSVAQATRRSTRQKAQACSVPVSKRATHRLIRAFEIAGPEEPIGDQAMESYISSFRTPMPDKAIRAVRMLTSLDSGPALAASAQLVAAEGGADVEELIA